MLLTRLLSPSEFGIVGIITSVFFAVAMLTDLGFHDFLIRHKRGDEQHFRDVLWTIHAKRGLIVFVGVASASPWIAEVFDKPVVGLPLACASLIFVFNGLASLSLITALRQDKSRKLSLIEFALQILQTATCLLLAFWWRSAWAIIAAMVLQSAVRTMLSYTFFDGSRQRLAHDQSVSSEFRSFSRVILASSALALVIAQLDKVVLARVFTLSEFGLYAIAITVASAPNAFAESFVNRIVYPVCAKAWSNFEPDVSHVYYKVRRRAAGLYGFCCGGLLGSAHLVLAVLYDPRYSPAAIFLSWLMISTILRLPNVAATQFMVASGRVRETVRMTIVRLLWLAVTIPAGLIFWGPIGVIAAIGLAEVPATLYSWHRLHRMHILDLKEEFGFLAMAGIGAGVGTVGGTIMLRFFPNL